MDNENLTDPEFLKLLESNGCALRVAGEKLRCVVPGGGGLDDNLRSEIARRKESLLELVRRRRVPLSHEQERLWFLDEYGGPRESAYHMPAAFRLTGELDRSSLAEAVGRLIERHESLRTVFRSEHGEPYQEIEPPTGTRLREEAVEEGELARALAREARRPFDLAKGPLTRFRLFRLGETEHVLMVCQHHIISDGWSTEILLKELSGFYAALASGRQYDIPPPALQYADYALWQRTDQWSERMRTEEEYWCEKLSGLEQLELLPDFNRPPVKTYSGKRLGFKIDPRTAESVRELAAEEDATPFMVLLTALKVLLHRLCEQDDVALGTPVANRGAGDLEGTVGFFVNTLVLRTGLAGNPSFREALKRVRQTCLEAYANPELPFGRLVDLLRAERDPARSPLFGVMFVLRHGDDEVALQLPGCRTEEINVTYDTAKFDLAFEMSDSPELLAGEVEYNTDLYAAETVGRLAAYYKGILLDCCREPELKLGDLDILSAPEKKTLLSDYNRTEAPFPNATLQALFREQAHRTPKGTAVVFGKERITYEQLNRVSDLAAASLLSALGGGEGVPLPPDTIVGLPATPGPDAIICLLGILKAGCAYLPLDLDYPPERLAFMLEDSAAKAILTFDGQIGGNLAEALRMVESRGTSEIPIVEAGGESAGAVRPGSADPHSLAYVIYTSGSTGDPKGVLIEHIGVSNLVAGQCEVFEIDASSRVLQFAPLGFDASVSEIFTALLSGAELHLPTDEVRRDADGLVDLIERCGITAATLPPALLSVIPYRRLPSLGTLVVAGDVCDEETMRRWSAGRRLINAYGPTEATVCASMRVWREGVSLRNIGSPMNNVRVYVLDERMRPSPPGVPGALYISGIGLARGYLNRPSLNEESFVINPFARNRESGGDDYLRLYGTGDRARWLPGGELEFLGRSDNQVKVRGFRVEPGEIEAALRKHRAVSDCAVAPIEDEGPTRLAAYLVPAGGYSETPSSTLREFLDSRLPAYLVPSAFIRLEALPVTSSGKIDRKALPPFEPRALSSDGEGRSPETAGEKKLASIWEQVLKLDRVCTDENFFALGGDSIMSIQVVSRAHEAGLELDPKDVFTYPTISALAARADQLAHKPLPRRQAKGEAPLTPIQTWFFELDMPARNYFNQAVLLRLDDELDRELVREAAKRLARRHDSLRLRFNLDDSGNWRQSYADGAGALEVPVHEVDLSERAETLGSECEKLQASLDIGSGPVAVMGLFTGLPDSRTRLLIAIHHLVVDAFSWRVLLDDFTAIYAKLREGKPVRFGSRRGSSYQEWGDALYRFLGDEAEGQFDYWLDAVKGTPPVKWELEGGEATCGELYRSTVDLDEKQTSDLTTKAPVAYHAAARDLLIAAFLLAWHRLFGGRDLLLDLEGHGRESIDDALDVTRTSGWFTSLYPVLLKLPPIKASRGDDRFYSSLIKAVKEELRSVPDGGLGYGVLRYLGGDSKAKLLEEGAPAEVAFNYLGRLDLELTRKLRGEIDWEGPGRSISPENPAPHPLEVNAYMGGGRLHAEFAASPRHLREETAENLAAAFRESLLELIEHCLKPGVGGHSPSDFPLVRLSQDQLDALTDGEETESIYGLAPMQEGLLFHALYAPESDQYVEQLCWTYRGELDSAALKKAWEQIVKRHGAFRTAFFHEGLERPVQVVRRRTRVDWREADWRDLPDGRLEEELEEYIKRDRSKGFDLRRPGLTRFHLIRTNDEEFEFIWCFHHILIDGWCSSLLLNELKLRYDALRGGRPFRLPPPPPFEEFITWLSSRDTADDEEFWRAQLAGMDEPTPMGMNRRALEIHRPIDEVDEAVVRFTETRTEKIVGFAREHRVTVNSILETAWAMVLGGYCGRPDVVLGVNVSGRPGEIAGVEKMVGLFVNAVPVRCALEQDGSALDAVLGLHSQMQDINAHSYGSLADIQRFSEVPSGTPLFFSEYVFENYPMDESVLAGPHGLSISGFRAVEKTNYPLGLMAAPGRELSIKAVYDVESFTRQSIGRMLAHLQTAVEWIVQNPASRLSEAELMPRDERETVIRKWSGAEVGIPQEGPPVVELFSRQAEREPDRVAVSGEGKRLTYGELHERSNGIAAALSGIAGSNKPGRNRTVGLCMTRGALTVAAILGINKAGAAYVPMDPDHPDERLRFTAEDARLEAILTEEKYLSRLRGLMPEGERPELVSLEGLERRPRGEAARRPHPEDIAYVIYTSGSTGIPKGVAITQRNLSDHLAAVADHYGITADDVILQFSTLTFDASLEQLFGALIAGATLVMRGELLWTPAELREVVLREGLTVMNLPTGYWREVARDWSDDPGAISRSRLRLVIVGGDSMDAETIDIWRSLPLPPHRFLNAYGPTETTITASTYEIPKRLGGAVPIGRPLCARRLYVLGGNGRVKPPGIPGELYIGGVGVSPGYLDRPDETSERFRDDPFASPEEGERGYGRLYKTGDIARWGEEGDLEFLGRSDFQAKLRGFRVEPGEIEVALGRYPAIAECAVVASGDGGEKELVAYYVPGSGTGDLAEAAGEAVSAWEALYDELFGRVPAGDFDTTGWNSSYDGSPIPPEEMREWVDLTVERILELDPKSVLEVGCGTGLILSRVAPRCRSYVGMDFSEHAILRLREQLARSPIDGVEVLKGRADGIGNIASKGDGRFPADTVIINSVVQYFPGLDYLEEVLELALDAVADGSIFIGDVRDLRLQDAFHLSVEIAKAGRIPGGSDLGAMLARDARTEKELLLSPSYFIDFAERHGRIIDVRTMPKQGRFSNEMNDYRYDVVLKTGGGGTDGAHAVAPTEVPWEPGLDLEGLLAGGEGTVVVHGYPNRRTWSVYGLSLLLDGRFDLDEEAAALKGEAERLLSMEQLVGLAAGHGYSLYPRLSLVGERAPARYELIFSREGTPPAMSVPMTSKGAEYANRPLARLTRAQIDPEDLREFISAQLPDYMVPTIFVELDALPTTPTGKPDRQALARLDRRAVLPLAEGYVAPRNEHERLLANIFSDVLRLERVGIADDFFKLGGHSLSATRVASRINRVFDVQCPVKSIFDHPGISDLASFIQSRLSGGGPVPPALEPTGETGRIPLSFAQERLWFLDRFEAVSESSYHMPAAFHLIGPLDVSALEKSFETLFARHESLRTVFTDEGGEPFQEIPAPESFRLDVEEVSGEGLEARLDRLVRLPFDLEVGPLVRVHCLNLGEDDHVLLINQHHIISDAWSIGVLFGELSECYGALSRDEEVELPPLAVRYADFAIWQKRWLTGEVLTTQLDYWREKLEGAMRLELPIARPRGEQMVRRGKQFTFRLDETATTHFKRRSREAGATLYMALLGAFAVLLGRYGGEDDVLVGTVVAGRTDEALEKIVGFFVNTLLLRIDLSGDPSFGGLLERVRETTLEAYAHQDLPFEKLVAELRPERGYGNSPLFSALLVFQNVPGSNLELAGLEVSPIGLELGAVRSDFDLYAWEEGGALEFCIAYDADLFEEETIITMAERLQGIIRLASKDAESPLSGVSSLEASEIPRPSVPIRRGAKELAPLSYHQERLWFIDRFEEGTVYESKPTYHNMPLIIRFDGPVDKSVLESSLGRVIQRHEVLRTRIETVGDGARQSVEAEPRLAFETICIEGADPVRLREEALEFAGRSFAPGEEPRLRAALVSGDGGECLLVIAVHHILADRRSLEIIADELAECYDALIEGKEPALPEEALTYAGFSEWQRGVSERDWKPLLYNWKWRLRGELPVLTLPEDRPRPAIHTYTAGVHEFSFPRELTERLEDFAQREQIDLFAVLLTGLMVNLLCYSGQEELVVGIFGNGRPEGAADTVGPFDNLLPIRGRPTADDTCRGFLQSVNDVVAEARANGELPFDLLVERMNPAVDISRTALFDVLFEFRTRQERRLRFGDVPAEVCETNIGLGKYDLNLMLIGDAERISGTATFNADIYDGPTVAGMMSRFETILENLVTLPDTPMKEFSFLTTEEERRQIDEWNDTATSFPDRATLHGLFSEQVERAPEGIALVCGDARVSYEELDDMANRLAHYLKGMGVGPDRLVALCLERSVETVAAMLAVLKAGGAYLPIEASFPEERIRFLLEDSGADILVTTSPLLEKVPGQTASVVLLDSDAQSIAAMPADPPDGGAAPENLAYCIYTSGSTGRPKGVLVEHRNVVRLLKNDRLPFEFSESDVWTMFHSYGFDFSVWEMYGALLFGGRLVVVPVETTRDSSLLLDFIKKEGVTVLNQVPSAFYSLSREILERGETDLPLRYVIFGGEALEYAMLKEWRESFSAVRLVNMYGITETCVHVTYKEVRKEDIAAGIGNIGRPLPDTTAYVMDRFMRLLPGGLPGEICVGGGGVARGYLGRDDLTISKFVPDPYRPSERLYRSGDVGRYLPNGELEYLGRIDDQVQIRGFRVEPGEIENRLVEHPCVERAAVRVWERHRESTGSDGTDVILAAYYVISRTEAEGKEPAAEDLKSFLAERLPGYMIPSYVIRMDALPLSPGGKLNRLELPDPRAVGRGPAEATGPRDPVELRLKEIWEELIGAGIDSIEEDFFLSGGHSLLAVRLISQINRSFETSYAVSWAFVNRTIEKQARALREERRSAPFRPLVAFNRKGDEPPLFFVHPGQAGAEAYSRLAALLDRNIPFYAIESRNLYDEERPMLRTIESLSQAYLDDVRSLCRDGRCSLGGWSFGGLVAFEMARRMLELGIEVEELYLVDTTCHDEEERELLRELAQSGEANGLLEKETLYRELPEAYRSRLLEVTRLEFEAMAEYKYGPYEGRAVLVKPTQHQPAPERGIESAALIEKLSARHAMAADNGWSPYIGKLEVRPVPGDHITMMEGRGLKEIARIVSGRHDLNKDRNGDRDCDSISNVFNTDRSKEGG